MINSWNTTHVKHVLENTHFAVARLETKMLNVWWTKWKQNIGVQFDNQQQYRSYWNCLSTGEDKRSFEEKMNQKRSPRLTTIFKLHWHFRSFRHYWNIANNFDTFLEFGTFNSALPYESHWNRGFAWTIYWMNLRFWWNFLTICNKNFRFARNL